MRQDSGMQRISDWICLLIQLDWLLNQWVYVRDTL